MNFRSHVSEGPTVKTFVAHCAWSLELPPRPFYFHSTLHYILHPVPVHYAADSKRRRYHVATRRHTVGLNCENPPKIRLRKIVKFWKWAARNDWRPWIMDGQIREKITKPRKCGLFGPCMSAAQTKSIYVEKNVAQSIKYTLVHEGTKSQNQSL